MKWDCQTLIEKIHFLWGREIFLLQLELKSSTVIAHFPPGIVYLVNSNILMTGSNAERHRREI